MSELCRTRFPAAPEAVPGARHAVVDSLAQAGLTDPGLHGRVALAVSEATANAVRHACPPGRTDGVVEVAVTRTGGTLTITVRDNGRGVAGRGSGLGMSIMTAVAQDVAMQSGESGTVVTLRFSI